MSDSTSIVRLSSQARFFTRGDYMFTKRHLLQIAAIMVIVAMALSACVATQMCIRDRLVAAGQRSGVGVLDRRGQRCVYWGK